MAVGLMVAGCRLSVIVVGKSLGLPIHIQFKLNHCVYTIH